MSTTLIDGDRLRTAATPSNAARELTFLAHGKSQFLSYLEAQTRWVKRIAPEHCVDLPHVFFVQIGMIRNVDDPQLAERRDSVQTLLSEYKRHIGANMRYSIVLDYSHEGPAFEEGVASKFIALHTLLRELGIPGRKVTFLHYNRILCQRRSGYIDWCYRYADEPMRMVYCNWWLLDQSALLHRRYGADETFRAHRDMLSRSISSTSPEKTHKYLSFNYFPRLHRILLLLSLIERGILKDGLVSFPGFRIKEVPIDFLEDVNANIDNWRVGRRLKPLLGQLQALAPLRVDTDATVSKVALNEHFVAAPFVASGFSVVTDTGFSNGLWSRCVTEKFLKPIVHMHPFLMMADPGSLEEIRQLGFRTFEGFFDESYDAVLPPENRFDAIIDNIARKADLGLPALIAEVAALRPVLDHNLHHAVYGLAERAREESEYPVVNHLLDDLGLPGPRIASRFAATAMALDDRVPHDLRDAEPLHLPADLRQVLTVRAAFDWSEACVVDGRTCHGVTADGTTGNHCVLLRVDRDLSRPFLLRFDVRSNGAERLLIQLKDPGTECFRAVFRFDHGIFAGSHNVDAFSTIEPRVDYRGDEWFTLSFAGRVGSGDGPLDIVIYAGRPEFDYTGDGGVEFWLADISLVRLAPER